MTIRVDNKCLIKSVLKEEKTSQYAQDCGAIISRFDLSVHILVEYSSAKMQKNKTFEDSRGRHFMLECDTKSKAIQR